MMRRIERFVGDHLDDMSQEDSRRLPGTVG
jgi:hypothetical protein